MNLRPAFTVAAISAAALCLASPARGQHSFARPDVREAIARIERHGDEFKSAFKDGLKDTVMASDREKSVRNSVEDLEDEVDNLQKNYKDNHYNEARGNLDTAMLLASPVNRYMLHNYFGPDAARAWSNLKADLNVIALGFGIPPLPNLKAASSPPPPCNSAPAAGSADRISTSGRVTAHLEKNIRHELVMLPYYGVFDNLAFRVDGKAVTLSGQVTRPTLKSDAEAAVRSIEGVERIVNNIEVLPPSPEDDRLRLAEYRAIYSQPALNRYALQAVPPIHIIVYNGNVTLEGAVANENDRNLANLQARGVPGVLSVTNSLRID